MFSNPLMAAIQEISARIGRVTDVKQTPTDREDRQVIEFHKCFDQLVSRHGRYRSVSRNSMRRFFA